MYPGLGGSLSGEKTYPPNTHGSALLTSQTTLAPWHNFSGLKSFLTYPQLVALQVHDSTGNETQLLWFKLPALTTRLYFLLVNSYFIQ